MLAAGPWRHGDGLGRKAGKGFFFLGFLLVEVKASNGFDTITPQLGDSITLVLDKQQLPSAHNSRLLKHHFPFGSPRLKQFAGLLPREVLMLAKDKSSLLLLNLKHQIGSAEISVAYP